MEQQKDYSLLRPFDLEAAKRGEAITCIAIVSGKEESDGPREFIAGPDEHGYFCVKSPDGWFRFGKADDYRMAPLCWVEGKPVYRGDVLFFTDAEGCGEVYGLNQDGHPLLKHKAMGCVYQPADKLTWTTPEVGREGWVNIYPAKKSGIIVALASHVYSSKAAADADAAASRIDCIRIEWEEPVGSEGGAQ